MKCRECGEDLKKGSKYCSNCGTSVVKDSNVKVNSNKDNNSSYSFLWGVLCFFVPIVGIVLFCLWSKTRKKDAIASLVGALIGFILSILVIVLVVSFFIHIIFKKDSNKVNINEINTICKLYCNSDNYTSDNKYCYCSNGKKYKINFSDNLEYGDDEEDYDDNENNFSDNSNEDSKEVDLTKASEEIKKWHQDIFKDKLIITVIGTTWCPHCQNFKPIITSVAKDKNVKLYFFEVDNLSEDDVNIIENSIKLENYNGGVPYTFATYDGKFLINLSGERSKEDTISFIDKAKREANKD